MKSEGKTGYGEKHRLADNPGTLPGVLARLACDDNWHVRLNVAHNPSTPVGILARLTRHNSQGVRIDAKREFTQRQNRGKDNQ